MEGTEAPHPTSAHGCVFVRFAEGSDTVTIVVRFPALARLPDACFSRPRDELLCELLLRMPKKIGPKPTKTKRNSADVANGSVVTVRLFDKSGEEFPASATNATCWPVADKLCVDGATQSLCIQPLQVYVNSPNVHSVRMTSDSPIIGIPLSAHSSLTSCAPAECSWSWYCSSNAKPLPGEEWVHVGNGRLYTPSLAVEGRYLRVCCQPPFPGDNAYSLRSKSPVQAGPKDDAWRLALFLSPLPAPVLRVATYNVLADAYTSEDLFSYCSPELLSAPRRRQLIVRDFLQIDADLIGLQECDRGQLVSLMPVDLLGWDHIYTGKLGGAADGCALFWKRSRFQVVSEPFDLKLGGNLDDMPRMDTVSLSAVKGHQMTKDVLTKVTTIAQGVLLRDLASNGRLLLVANTHLFYHANANHIRLLQLYMITLDLTRRKLEAAKAEGAPVAVVLLGDLNARKFAERTSEKTLPPQAAYRFVRDGVIFPDDVDWTFSSWCPEDWQSKHCEPAADTTVCICCDGLGYIEVYGTCPLCDGLEFWNEREPHESGVPLLRLELRLPLPLMDPNPHVENTNFTSFFQNCLDYTLVDSDLFRAARLIEMPTLAQLEAETALPSSIFPSDHVPVVVDLEYVAA